MAFHLIRLWLRVQIRSLLENYPSGLTGKCKVALNRFLLKSLREQQREFKIVTYICLNSDFKKIITDKHMYFIIIL
jgi:hypothetical protein